MSRGLRRAPMPPLPPIDPRVALAYAEATLAEFGDELERARARERALCEVLRTLWRWIDLGVQCDPEASNAAAAELRAALAAVLALDGRAPGDGRRDG